MKPVISVIIPTRNRAASLPAALDSVFAQRGWGSRFEIEVIVVDDASSDATPLVVKRYPLARHIRLPAPRGSSAARNEGLRVSAGRYVAFLDDDDTWLPWKLETQVPVIEAHPDVGVVYSQFQVRLGDKEWLYPENDRAPSGWVFTPMLMGNCCGGSLLIRRLAFEWAGYFDESFTVYEDYDLWLRLAFHVPFLFVPGPVAIYNLSPQGLYLSSATDGPAVRDRARIVRRGLAMLPASEEAALSEEVEACADLESVTPLLMLGKVGEAWPRLLGKLSVRQGALRYLKVRRLLKWAAFMRLAASPSHLQAIREIQGEIRSAARENYRGDAEQRHACAVLWANIAACFAEDEGMRLETARAAMNALLYGPDQPARREMLRLIARAFSPRWMRSAVRRLVGVRLGARQ